MKIYLESRNNRLLVDSTGVVEKVTGLINFRDVPSDSRWILRQSPQGEIRHPENNWCTPQFSDSLQLAIRKFYNWSLSEEGSGTAIAVSLNDLSLPLGGRFDISARWDGRDSQDHLYHRVGTSVDVNQTLSDAQLRKLTVFMENAGLERNAERPQIHYGSDGGN